MARRRQISIYLDGKQVEGSMRNIRKSYKKARAELEFLTKGTDDYNKKVKEIKGLNKIIRDHRESLRPTKSVYDKMTAGLRGYVGIAVAAFTTDAIIRYGSELFNLGSEMEVLTRKAQTVFGQALPQVTRAAQENATAMGLTASQYTDAATAIGDLLIPMKFTRQEAADISTNLVDLSGALSEWTGGQRSAAEVSQILSKAMLGEREQLKELGIAISENDIKMRLAEKGAENLTGELLQQAKAVATLELITEKSADAQAAFATNSDTLVRKQAELNAKFTQIRENIANALVPVFTRLLDAATPFVNLIDRFVGIPLSQALQQEQRDLNVLVARITEANIKQEDRNALIGQLQQQYPGFLGNLKAEEATNEDLSNRLREVNDQYIFKIALQKEDEKIQKAAEKLADRQRALAEKDIKIQEKLIDLNQEYGLGVDFANKSLAERVDLVQDALKEQQAQANNDIASIRIGKEIAGLEVSGRKVVEDRVNKRQEELDALKATREEIKKNLAAELGIDTSAPASGNPAPSSDDAPANNNPDTSSITGNASQQIKATVDTSIEELNRLKAKVNDLRSEFTTGLLPEQEKAIAAIEKRYDAELAKALELSTSNNKEVANAALQQVLELEALKEQEIFAKREEFFLAQLEQDIEYGRRLLDEENKRFQEKQAIQAEVDAFLKEQTLSDRELELAELKAHYDSLAAAAEEFGIDTTEITRRYREEVNRINKDFNNKDQKEKAEAIRAEAQAASEAFGGLSAAVEGFQKLAEQGGKRGAILAKTLALINIAAKSAEAIASGIAASAGVPFPANLAAIGTTVATVLANVATAKSILSDAPEIPQRRMGGFLNVTGADDGRAYNAEYIGMPGSGMLPNRPVVLASENGPEYFVANEDLRNPVVLDHVRAIENIRKARLGQFQDGGSTEPLPQSSGSSSSASQDLKILNEVLTRLADRLDKPIYTLLQDTTLVEAKERLEELSAISGGVL
ncbi:MAG: hypothetical protein AAF242_06235 [Bacteroidota bacterium]